MIDVGKACWTRVFLGGRGRRDVAYVVIVEGGSEEGHEMMRTCVCKGEGERERERERERETLAV